MRTRTILGSLAALVAFTTSPAQAAIIDLFESQVNVDGATTAPSSLDGSGLGSVAVTVTGAGPHSVLAYFDHEIDELLNTFFNEFGAVVGAPGAGQSYEIDEPGFAGVFGDIFANFGASTLDNSVVGGPEDISMAMGFNFVLTAAQTALVTFIVDDVLPTIAPSFYLRQDDFASEASVYLWGTLDIRGGVIEPPPPTSVPEPTTLALLAAGLLSLGLGRRALRR